MTLKESSYLSNMKAALNLSTGRDYRHSLLRARFAITYGGPRLRNDTPAPRFSGDCRGSGRQKI